MTTALLAIARHARAVLVAGLVAGLALPDLAAALKPWIAEFVLALLFVAALRVGACAALGALGDLGGALAATLALQVATPLAMLLALAAVGATGPVATGLVLMAAASPISGAPNLTVMTGNDPAPALRQLVVGTALLGVTVVPVFWLARDLGDAASVARTAGALLLSILAAGGLGFLARAALLRDPGTEAIRAIDGLSALLMAVVVVGLMAAVGPAITAAPGLLALTLAAAFAGNIGLQLAAAAALRGRAPERLVAPLAICAGNRNIALFLVALPPETTDPLLLFIGCYQIPMYLTPILLGRLYRPIARKP